MRRWMAVLVAVVSVSTARAEEGAKLADEAWMNAAKANSLYQLVHCYAEDAVMWLPGAPEARGHQAIRESYQKTLAQFVIRDAVLSDTNYREAGELSVGWGRFALTLVEKSTGNTNVWAGRYTTVAKRQGDRWVYVVDHASAEPGK